MTMMFNPHPHPAVILDPLLETEELLALLSDVERGELFKWMLVRLCAEARRGATLKVRQAAVDCLADIVEKAAEMKGKPEVHK